jgi:hypothetical protein
MKRIYTKRIMCRACCSVFTMTSAASKFCKLSECRRKRRPEARVSAQRQAPPP